MKKLTISSTLIITSFVAVTAFAGLLDKDVDYSTLSPTVQDAITQRAQGGTIDSIQERPIKEDGIKVYKIEATKTDGTKIEFKVDTNGDLIQLEKD